MNNKGFTLVELLAVILILIGIAGVSVASITASLQRNDDKECEKQKEIVINATKIFFSLSGSKTNVTVGELLQQKIIENEKDVSGIANFSIELSNGEYFLVPGDSAENDKCYDYFNVSEPSS